jgi:adenosylmethionine-8-amino-7-oxononanoate aminotransferase
MAKGITSGYAPLGGVLVAPRVADRFFTGPDAPIFRHGLTYSGHATACAVALANLDVLAEESLVAEARRLEVVLEQLVKPLRDSDLVIDVRAGAGFMAGIQLHAEVDAERIIDACAESGVLIRTIHNNTLQICPPFVCTDDDVARIVDAIDRALDSYEEPC